MKCPILKLVLMMILSPVMLGIVGVIMVLGTVLKALKAVLEAWAGEIDKQSKLYDKIKEHVE